MYKMENVIQPQQFILHLTPSHLYFSVPVQQTKRVIRLCKQNLKGFQSVREDGGFVQVLREESGKQPFEVEAGAPAVGVEAGGPLGKWVDRWGQSWTGPSSGGEAGSRGLLKVSLCC